MIQLFIPTEAVINSKILFKLKLIIKVLKINQQLFDDFYVKLI